MSTVAEKLEDFGVVPVVVIHKTTDARALAKALVDGGLPCAEITFRTKAAEESIRIMVDEYPHMLIGAGTILTITQVEQAVKAGAKFIVSPGFDPEIVDYCLTKNIPIFPGCITPSEVAQAVKRGLKLIKFFPAQSFGGLSTIKAIAAPYGDIKFMPTGGITENNLVDYLSYSKVAACGGSFMVPSSLIEAGDFTRITALTKEAVKLVASAKQ